MDISILEPLARRLLAECRIKFQKEIETRKIKVPSSEDGFWFVKDKDEKVLFSTLVSSDIRPTYLSKKIRFDTRKDFEIPSSIAGDMLEKSYFGWDFNDFRVEKHLEFLGFKENDLRSRFLAFCQASLVRDRNEDNNKEKVDIFNGPITITEDLVKVQFEYLWSAISNRKEAKVVRRDLSEWLDSKANNLCQTYSHYLCNTCWWLYFYGYDKLSLRRDRNSWNLVKLVFRFHGVDNGEILATIENTNTPEHYDFIGRTDFRTSKNELLVLNFVTDPHYTRQLNMKIHVGIGDGELLLGQYLNYEGNGNIISGTVILQSAKNVPDEELVPAVHKVPKLSNGQKKYEEDHDGVSKHILQYMHDKKKNFRRTTLRAGHSLKGLGDWLESRLEEED